MRFTQADQTIKHADDEVVKCVDLCLWADNVPLRQWAAMLLDYEDVMILRMLVCYCAEYGGAVERCVGEKITKMLVWEQVAALKDRSLPTGFF